VELALTAEPMHGRHQIHITTLPWLPQDITLCVPKVTAIPHKDLAESDLPVRGVNVYLLRTEITSCLREGGVKVLSRVDLDGQAELGWEGVEGLIICICKVGPL